MLLVFEDGAGNLVQFSKNKISNIDNFFRECKYHNIVELTAKEVISQLYPLTKLISIQTSSK